MSSSLHILLAQQSRIEDLGSGLRGGSQSSGGVMALVVLPAVVAGLILLLWLTNRHFARRQKHGYWSHAALFRELCRAHGLTWSESRLLRQIARRRGIEPASAVFIQPNFLPENAFLAPESRRAEIESIRRHLFV